MPEHGVVEKTKSSPEESSGGTSSDELSKAKKKKPLGPRPEGPVPVPTDMMVMALGFKKLGNIDKQIEDLKMSKSHQVVEGVISAGADALDITSQVDGGTGVTEANAWTGLSLAAVGTLVNTYKAVKLILDKEDLDKVEAGLTVAEAIKSATSGAVAIFDIVDKAPAGLQSTVPALGIAISVVKIIRNSIAFSTSIMAQKAMKAEHKKLIENNDNIEEAVEWHREHDAEMANKKYLIKMDFKRFSKSDDPKEKAKLQERIKATDQYVSINEFIPDPKSGLSREDVAELALVLELERVSKKRMKRLSIALTADIAKIAGNIAILSGGGAIGGAVVNGAASALETGAVAVRGAKQKGRDRAARKEAKGKGGSKIFDTSKSSVAKSDYRLEQVQTLVELAVKTPQENIEKVTNYYRATGVDMAKLFSKNGNAIAQIRMLYDAINKRDA